MPNFDIVETKPAPSRRWYVYGSGGGSAPSVYNANAVVMRVRRYKQGQKYPWATYLAYKSAGLIPTQPSLTHYTETCINPSNPIKRALAGTWYGLDGRPTSASRVGDGAYGIFLDGVPPSLVLSGRLTTLKADSTQAAKLKAKDLKLNVAQFIAEYGQARQLIADTAVSIAKAFRHVRHGRPDRALQELTFRLRQRKLSPLETRHGRLRPFDNPRRVINKRVSDSWLQLQYGWLPLISDATSAAELLAQTMVGRPIRQTVKSQVKDSWTERTTGAWTWDSTPNLSSMTYYHDVQIQAVARTGYVIDITNANLATLAQTGLTDPLLLAWELLPYSFVVDWFYQIGDYLSALTAFNGITIRDRWQSLQVTQNGIVEYYAPWAGITRDDSPKTRWSRRWYQRLNSVTDPVFHIRKGSGFNLTRVGNALALLSGAFGRSLPRSTPYWDRA